MPYSYPPHKTTSTMMSVVVEEQKNNNNNNDFNYDHDHDNGNDVSFKILCHNCHSSFDNNSIVSSSEEISSVSANNTTTMNTISSNTKSSNPNPKPKRVYTTYRQRRQILKEMTGKNLKNLQILPVLCTYYGYR